MSPVPQSFSVNPSRIRGSWRRSRSIGVGRNHLAAGDRPQAPPDHAVDAALDELDGAVAQEDVDAAGMVAAGIDRREGRAAELFIERRSSRDPSPAYIDPAHDLLVGRPGRGEARRVGVAVGPLGVELELVLRDASAVVIFGRDRVTGRRRGWGCCSGY